MATKQPRQRNDEERQARFNKHFSRLDRDGSGELDYEEFKTFLIAYNKKEMPEKQYDFYFRGGDIDGSGDISKAELFKLVEALYKNDQLYINKLFFRAVDKDRSREIDAGEFVTMADLNGRQMSESQAEEQIGRLTGGKSVLTFAQMHKALTGQDIAADTDPYDGQIPMKKDSDSSKEKSETTESSSAHKAHDTPKKEDKPKKDGKPIKEGATSDSHSPASGIAKIFLIIMMILAFLSFAAFIIIGAAFLYNYIDIQKKEKLPVKFGLFVGTFFRGYQKAILGGAKILDDSDPVAKAKLTAGIKPGNIDLSSSFFKDCLKQADPSEKCRGNSFDNIKGYITIESAIYLLLDWLMAPGIGSIILGAVNLLVAITLLLELIGKPIRILKALLYAPVLRGLSLVFISVPAFGVSSLLGLSAAIIGIVVGALEMIFGIIEKIMVKPAKVSA